MATSASCSKWARTALGPSPATPPQALLEPCLVQESQSELMGCRPRPLDSLQEQEGSSGVLAPRCRPPPPPGPPFRWFRASNEKVAEPDRLLPSLASCTQNHNRLVTDGRTLPRQRGLKPSTTKMAATCPPSDSQNPVGRGGGATAAGGHVVSSAVMEDKVP